VKAKGMIVLYCNSSLNLKRPVNRSMKIGLGMSYRNIIKRGGKT
jgi:hypothetical protein